MADDRIRTRVGAGTAGAAKGSIRTSASRVHARDAGRGPKKGSMKSRVAGRAVATMARSEDESLQELAAMARTARVGVRASRKAGSVAGRSMGAVSKRARRVAHSMKAPAGHAARRVRTSAGKVRSGGAFIKERGLKRAFQEAWKGGGRMARKVGGSVTSVVIQAVRSVAAKVAVPLLLVVVVAGGLVTVVSIPVMAVGSLVDGVLSFFSGDGEGGGSIEEVEASEYLQDPVTGIPPLLDAYKGSVQAKVQEALNGKAVVRFKSDLTGADVFLGVGRDAEGNAVIQGFDAAFPSADDLLPILQPAYCAVVAMEYERGPTRDEAQGLLREMFPKVFSLAVADTAEKCGQGFSTGEGTADPACASCGNVHARSDCPNAITGVHASFTCPSCCYYYCGGHVVNGAVKYVEGCTCKHACRGFRHCGGHAGRTFCLTVNYNALEREYFTKPLDELNALRGEERPADWQERVQKLEDYHEVFLEMKKEMTGG